MDLWFVLILNMPRCNHLAGDKATTDHCLARKGISWDRKRTINRLTKSPAVDAAAVAPAPETAVAPAQPAPPPLDAGSPAPVGDRLSQKQKKDLLKMKRHLDEQRQLAVGGSCHTFAMTATASAASHTAITATTTNVNGLNIPSHLEPLPDPALDPQEVERTLELGQIIVPVVAVEGMTIADLIPRVHRTDFFSKRGINPSKPDYYGSVLCLCNLFDQIMPPGEICGK